MIRRSVFRVVAALCQRSLLIVSALNLLRCLTFLFRPYLAHAAAAVAPTSTSLPGGNTILRHLVILLHNVEDLRENNYTYANRLGYNSSSRFPRPYSMPPRRIPRSPFSRAP